MQTVEVPIKNSIAKNIYKGLKAAASAGGSIGAVISGVVAFGLLKMTPDEIAAVTKAFAEVADSLAAVVLGVTVITGGIHAALDAGKTRTKTVEVADVVPVTTSTEPPKPAA
ncbi:MAG: hypothetical protein AMXMBFR84_49520 [Candidatus Hydrogenedentota bacterium]